MRIGIDARFYGPYGKGLGRYTQKLVDHLQTVDDHNEYFILLRRENWADFQPTDKRFHKILADYRWYSVSEQFFMPLKLWSLDLDLVHFTHFNVPLFYFGKFIVTIHDLILTKYPTERASTLGPWLYRIKHALYQIVINSAVKRAMKVVAVSEYTKKEVVRHFKCTPEKVAVTLEAVDPVPLSDGGEVIIVKYHIAKPYILYVGNAYPHKNCERLVEAFQMLLKEEPGYHLVMVGREDYFYSRLKKLVSQKELTRVVHFPGFVTDSDLPAFYRHARVYAFPSLCEGFGLPALEGCQYGVPVVASNNSSLPEVLGEAAVYFNPEKTDEMYQAIRKVISDERLTSRLVAAGYERVKQFSWEAMSKQTMDIYRSVIL